MKKTYLYKEKYISTDWHSARSDRTVLLQGNQPCIQDTRTTVLHDAYEYVSPEAFQFIADCYDKKNIGSQKEPAEFRYEPTEDMTPEETDKVLCFWDGNEFHVETICMVADYSVLLTYIHAEQEEQELVYLPIVKFYRGLKYGNTQERLFTDTLFETYSQACSWKRDFLKNIGNQLSFDAIDVMPVIKSNIETSLWYRIQVDILKTTEGYSPLFEQKFKAHGDVMYAELFGKSALDELINQYKNQ